ncbi:MAG: hypothetical protein ABIH42_08595 [Planctomycetota bacterium]
MNLLGDLKTKEAIPLRLGNYIRWALVILLTVFVIAIAVVMGALVIFGNGAVKAVEVLLKHVYLHYGLIPVLILLILVAVGIAAFIAQLIATALLYHKAYLKKDEELPEKTNSPLQKQSHKTLLKESNWKFVVVLAVSNAILAIFLVWGAVYAFGYIGIDVAEQPKFCTMCHNMSPAYKTYEESSHAGVACGECHNEPGVKGFVKGEVYAPIKESWLYAAQEYGKKPMVVHLKNSSCLREECHKKKRLLEEDFIYEKLVFNHKKHLELTHGGKELHCTACHTGSKEKHMAIDNNVCSICHFNSKYESTRNLTCESCHIIRPALEGNNEILHRDKVDALKRPCLDCHEIKKEEALVTHYNCDKCHKEFMEITNSEEIHKQHNAVRCTECHKAPKHVIGKENFDKFMFYPFNKEFPHSKHESIKCTECHVEKKGRFDLTVKHAGECTTCHHKEEDKKCAVCHSIQDLLFEGKSVFGLKERPSVKFDNGMSCDTCHVNMKEYSREEMKKTCEDCHDVSDDAYNLDKLKVAGEQLLKEAEKTASAARELLHKTKAQKPEIDKAKILIKDALDMISFAEKDKSFGLHNPELWKEIVNKAAVKAKEALKLLQEKK